MNPGRRIDINPNWGRVNHAVDASLGYLYLFVINRLPPFGIITSLDTYANSVSGSEFAMVYLGLVLFVHLYGLSIYLLDRCRGRVPLASEIVTRIGIFTLALLAGGVTFQWLSVAFPNLLVEAVVKGLVVVLYYLSAQIIVECSGERPNGVDGWERNLYNR